MDIQDAKIAVIGLGYVGLPLAVMLARVGYQVVGVDIEEIVGVLEAGVGVHVAAGLLHLLINAARGAGRRACRINVGLFREDGRDLYF